MSIKVGISVGHCYKDMGAENKELGVTEFVINSLIIEDLIVDLNNMGISPIIPPTDLMEPGEDLRETTKLFKEENVDAAIELHLNSISVEEPNKIGGALFIYYKNNIGEENASGKKLAMDLSKEYSTGIPEIKNRGIYPMIVFGNKWFLTDQKDIPAVIIESGFISNINKTRLFLDSFFRKRIANCICNGICNFFDSSLLKE